ncbi:MAG: tetratricopeptide repeat protein [Candidatus Kapabacteria bacterium]|nr:tetratricopeptide repeat protein [Ignavibacteriota bacterium]MCW5886433.1 tetratricopeptide repeat protein [Candidatus Kapabacteria bacterium]
MKILLLLLFILNLSVFSQTADEHYNYALVKFFEEDYYGAMIQLSKAIEMKPDFAEAYGNRGFVYFNIGDTVKALNDFDKALELNPALHTIYNNRGYLNILRNNYDLAIQDLEKAISIKPDFAEAIYNQGLAYYELKQLDKACELWYQAGDLGYTKAFKNINEKCR